MASTRQLKHHARFHAAVLRHFFPSSSHQEASDFSEEVSFQVESPKSTEQVLEETHTGNKNGEVEAGRALLSRAQRKRLKMKKVKERQSNALHAKRFVGPLLPGLLEKRRLENDDWNPAGALLQENVTIEKSSISPSAREEPVFEDMGKPEVLNSTAGEELAMAKIVEATTGEEVAMAKVEEATPSLLETGEELAMAKTEEATSSLLETGEELAMLNTEETTSLPETGEGKIMHDTVELEVLSKAKRRRLAKKKFHDSIRHPTSGSTFTAEIKGGDIIIKQVR